MAVRLPLLRAKQVRFIGHNALLRDRLSSPWRSLTPSVSRHREISPDIIGGSRSLRSQPAAAACAAAGHAGLESPAQRDPRSHEDELERYATQRRVAHHTQGVAPSRRHPEIRAGRHDARLKIPLLHARSVLFLRIFALASCALLICVPCQPTSQKPL